MAIVLIPGFMLDADLWSDISHDLEPFGPIIHADPAHAGSIEEMAAQTLAAAPGAVTIIGFSMGGYVAREVQRKAPERVSKLVLIATSARGDGTVQAQRKATVAAAGLSTFRGLSKASIRRSLAPDHRDEAVIIHRIQAMGIRFGAEVFRRQALFRRDGDLKDLPAITCPTLIVAGSKDRLRSLDESAEMHAAIPNSRIEVVEAGHMIPIEAPAALSAPLRDFLTG